MGVKAFVLTTLAILSVGFVGWLVFLSSTAQPPNRLDDVLVAEVTEEKVTAAFEPVQTLSTPDVAETTPPETVEMEDPPESLDPPLPTPDIIDAVSKPHLGEDARNAAMRAFKRNAQVIRRLCPDAVGKRIGIETLVSQSGRISWAVPLNRTVSTYKCVADNMKRVKSGSRLKKPTKVRLYVEP